MTKILKVQRPGESMVTETKVIHTCGVRLRHGGSDWAVRIIDHNARRFKYFSAGEMHRLEAPAHYTIELTGNFDEKKVGFFHSYMDMLHNSNGPSYYREIKSLRNGVWEHSDIHIGGWHIYDISLTEEYYEL